jgi:multisubunit Na+/H+ antiporter MnhE subunit
MIHGLVLHAGLAVAWLLLSRGGIPSLVFGAMAGYGFLWLFRDLLRVREYIRRTGGFVRFLAVFLRAFILSNIRLAQSILFQPLDAIHPGFIRYEVGELGRFELYLLAQCITLTPGTTTVEIADDGRALLLHAFEASDPAAVCAGIDATLKKAILEFTR